MDLSSVNEFVSTSKGAIDLLKAAVGLLPKGPDADEVQRKVDKADSELQLGRAQLAKALGYHLCQCAFPPQIMLSVGRHPQFGKEIFKCPSCGKQEPSEQFFSHLEQEEIRSRQEVDWISARN